MSDNKDWTISLNILRTSGRDKAEFETFTCQADPDEYVLDLVERIWAFHDRSLVYRHACHHSTCGACAMRVNGQEKLTCITTVSDVCSNGGTIRLEPLRNFPVVADLAVDMSSLYTTMEYSGHPAVHPVKGSALPYEDESILFPEDIFNAERLSDCIECGMCISACPSAITDSTYFGPAGLAGADVAATVNANPEPLIWADCAEGAWRCHSAFECTEVCPSNVDPAWRIMNLRRGIIKHRIRRIFKKV